MYHSTSRRLFNVSLAAGRLGASYPGRMLGAINLDNPHCPPVMDTLECLGKRVPVRGRSTEQQACLPQAAKMYCGCSSTRKQLWSSRTGGKTTEGDRDVTNVFPLIAVRKPHQMNHASYRNGLRKRKPKCYNNSRMINRNC